MYFKHSLIALTVMNAIALHSYAQTQELDTIEVNAKEQQKETAIIKKDTEHLAKQMVSDSRDLVRHETGISVVEAGRFGASGYAIRGVDENRVAITIDGLRQAETLANQGFKELFEGYGNFNNTRNSVEIETLKEAVIRKGADSVATGSGALGGSVTFETKDARDYLLEKDWHLGYKTGYATADNQRFNSITTAGRYKWFDALLVATKRNGHELENFGYKNYNALAQGKTREKADPYSIEADSLLAKISVSPTENHRLTLTSDINQRTSRGHDFSYNLKGWKDASPEDDLRHTHDQTKRKFFSVSYENTASNLLWDTAKIGFANQSIKTKARTDDYCDGNEKCKQYDNPYGLKLQNGKIVDKDGNTPKVVLHETRIEYPDDEPDIIRTPALADAQGNIIGTGNLDEPVRNLSFDCAVFDCNQPVSYYSVQGSGAYATLQQNSATLNQRYTDPNTGKTYARSSSFSNLSNTDYIVYPRSLGYVDNIYTDRDLNTDTKQLNLDFTKSVDIFDKSNMFTYGGAYSQIDKEMINRTGTFGRNPQWWAETFIGLDSNNQVYASCATAKADTASSISRNIGSLVCPSEDVYSFLIPVKTKDKSLYLTDKIALHDKFTLDLGYRYNQVNYKPNYVPGQTAKIPDDMVRGLFIPETIATAPVAPSLADPKYTGYDDPKFIAALDAYRTALAQFNANPTGTTNNAAENIAYFSKPKKFSQNSYSLAGTFEPTEYLRLQAKYAKGFRMPTTDEMYFTFQHPDLTVLPNVNLKPEIAKTKELALTAHSPLGFITGSLFRTDYDQFIDFAFLGTKNLQNIHGGQTSSRNYPLYQSVNRESAKVQGVEINSSLNVGEIYSSLKGVTLGYKLTYQTGKTGEGKTLNAIQPMASVLSLGYDAPTGRFGANLYLTHISRKKAKDTTNLFYDEERGAGDDNASPYITWRSDSYTLVDFTTYVKPVQNLTLRAGVYNLMNRKYITWDSARSIRSFGTSNLIDQETGAGINRFYAPERNFKLSAEFTF